MTATEFSHKTKFDVPKRKFNLTVNNFDKLRDTLTENFMSKETSKGTGFETSTTSAYLKKPLKGNTIGESYNNINFVTVQDNDGLLMTQAKEEKTRRDKRTYKRKEFRLASRINSIKQHLKSQDNFLKIEKIGSSIQLELIVNYGANRDYIYLQKVCATASVIETFLTLYNFHFQSLTTKHITEDMSIKVLDRLKDFLRKCSKGAFEIEINNPEIIKTFSECTKFRRNFLNSEEFFTAKPIEGMALSYLFLEYKLAANLLEYRRMVNQLSVKFENLSEDNDYPSKEGEQVDLRTDEQKKKEDQDAQNSEMKENLKKLRLEIMSNREGIVDKGGELGYFSKYLKRIEMCLQNKDELFSLERDDFDKMIDLQVPYIKPENFQADIVDDPMKRKIYLELVDLRNMFNDEIHNEVANLASDLDLYAYADQIEQVSVTKEDTESISSSITEEKTSLQVLESPLLEPQHEAIDLMPENTTPLEAQIIEPQ